MAHFIDETAVVPSDTGRFTTRLTKSWDIGENANGGYAVTPVLRAMQQSTPHTDPLSVTAHFLRPTDGSLDTNIEVETIRSGRSVATMRAGLAQRPRPDPDDVEPSPDVDKVVVLAAFGTLDGSSDDVVPGGEWQRPAPSMPPPDECVHRSGLEQGVDLPILSRVEVRVHPDHAVAGESQQAVMDGWIRFVDEHPPDTLAIPLFADAFPPSVFSRLGYVGWVPTIELTVQVRRRPANGWVQARFETDDLAGRRFIESGTLWDAAGRVVGRSRQLGMVLT